MKNAGGITKMAWDKNNLRNSRAWVPRNPKADAYTANNMSVNVAPDVAEGLGMNNEFTSGKKVKAQWASEVNVGAYKDILDDSNRFVLSLIGELDTYKEWVDNIFADIDNFATKYPELKDQIEVFHNLLKTKEIYKLVPLVMMKGLEHNALIERFMQEQAKYHMSAKSKGLLPKDSHYRVNQNWQTIAKQGLTATDLSMLAPELSSVIKQELIGDKSINSGEVMDYLKKAEQLVKDKGMSDTEWLDTLIEIEHAAPFLWTNDTLEMAIKMPLPEHTVDETLMPLPSMFFTFEQPVYFGDYMGRRYMTFLMLTLVTLPEGSYINWTCDSRDLNYFRDYVDREGICEGEHSLEEFEDGHYEHCAYPPYRFLQPQGVGTDWIEYGWIKLGTQYPMDDFQGDPKKKSMNDFISNGAVQLLNFLNTTAVKVERTGLSRSIRRDKSIDTKTREQEINVINLRREKYKGEYIPTGDGTGKTVDWKNEFWVTGHYRKQRYGLGRSKIKIIWIKTFMKAKGKGKAKKKLYKVVQ